VQRITNDDLSNDEFIVNVKCSRQRYWKMPKTTSMQVHGDYIMIHDGSRDYVSI